MNRIFLLLVVIAVLISCSNESPSKEFQKAGTPEKREELPAQDTATPASPFALRTAEMEDDSVFADGSQPVSWANAGIDHPIACKEFVKRIQSWVQHNQKDSIAAVIAFPLTHPPVKNKAAFLAKYDSYFTAKVKSALAQQNLRQIFRSSQGAMIGDGQLWISEFPKGFFIISINY